MKYRAASCFSGIGAPEIGGPQFDWIWNAEIEPFPCAVLANRFGASRPVFMPDPDDVEFPIEPTPAIIEYLNRRDEFGMKSQIGELIIEALSDRKSRINAIKAIETIKGGNDAVNFGDVLNPAFLERAAALGPIDLLAGGPPCQAFSVAGLRGSMDDPRGNLSLRWVQINHAIKPRNSITENVPGWLSTPDNAFGCFLAGLIGGDDPIPSPTGGKWPDCGMVQGPRSRAAWRVFDAQYFGLAQRRRRAFVVADFGNGADPARILFERSGLQGNIAPSREAGEGYTHELAPTLTRSGRGVERAGDSRGQDAVIPAIKDATDLVFGFSAKDHGGDALDDLAPTMRSMSHDKSHANASSHLAVAFDTMQITGQARGVRRLMPIECERLQGFPDDFTNIEYRGKPVADGPRYKSLGNSWAVNVGSWIISRIYDDLAAIDA